MENEVKRIQPIEIEFPGARKDDPPKHFELDFDITAVKALAAKSRQLGGRLLVSHLIQYAMRKHDEITATEKNAKDIYALLQSLDDDHDSEHTYEEMIAIIYRLFTQAIDDESRKEEPAEIDINDHDNTVLVTYNGEPYRLSFTRSDLERAYQEGRWEYSLDNPLELYTAGIELIKLALKGSNKSYSVRLPERLFLAMWRTALEPETKDKLVDALNALLNLRNDVVNSASKNSKATIRLKS